MTIANAILPVLFLAALILIRAARPALTDIDSTGFTKLSTGFSLLSGLSLLEMLFRLDAIHSLFTPELLFWPEFVGWSGALAGVTLVASGVASSLPLIRLHREERVERNLGIELLGRIQEMADDMSLSLEKLFALSVRDMATTFGFKSFAMFTFSLRSKKMALRIIANSHDETANAFCSLSDIDKSAFLSLVEKKTPLSIQALSSDTAKNVSHPDTIIPVQINNHVVGYYLFWSEGAQITEDKINALNQSANIVGRRVDREGITLKNVTQSSWIDLLSRLSRLSATRKSLPEVLPSIQSGLSELTSVNTVVVAIIDTETNKLNRFTVGPAGSVLLERNLTQSTKDLSARNTAPETHIMTINNLASISKSEESTRQLLTPYSTRGSLSSYRLILNNSQVALVGFYSEQSNAFTQKDEELLLLTRSHLSDATIRESFQTASLSEETEMASIRQLITGLSAVGGSKVELQNTVSFLLRGNNIDAARISLLDDGNFLESKALACRTTRLRMLPADGTQILSLMPGHQRAINSGRAVILDRMNEADYCSPSESAQMLDNSVASALICPIFVEGVCSGTLTLMSNDETGEILRSVKMVEYMTAVSSLIGLSLTWQGTGLSKRVSSGIYTDTADYSTDLFERRQSGVPQMKPDSEYSGLTAESLRVGSPVVVPTAPMTSGLLESDLLKDNFRE